MKWTIVGLIFVGLIAAVSAAVLAVTLRVDVGGEGGTTFTERETQEIEILVATRALPAMSMVDSSAIAKDKIKRSEAPPNALTNTSQVIGRVLNVPMLAGQAFTATQFASDSGMKLAVAIPERSRAVSVMLSDETGIEQLLYPGSIVDVIASFRFPAMGGNTSAESVSVTLLQGLQVLAVGNRTIITDESKLEEATGSAIDPGGRRGRMITLMVNTSQAEALQLAATNGKISVSLRNPLDLNRESATGTRISDLSKDLADRIARLAESEVGMVALTPPEMPKISMTSSGDESGSAPVVQPKPEVPLWMITVLRGGQAKEVQKFPMPVQE